MSRKGRVYNCGVLAGILEECAEGYRFTYDRAFLAEYRRVLSSYDAYVEAGPGAEVVELLNPETSLVGKKSWSNREAGNTKYRTGWRTPLG